MKRALVCGVIAFGSMGCESESNEPRGQAAFDSGAFTAEGGAPQDSSTPPACTSCDEVAAGFSGLRWELPCVTDTSPELCTTGTVDVVKTSTLRGTAGTTYDVELRFRGVIEPKTYTGGTRDGFFQTGGAAANDTANVYKLTVSEPAGTFFVNAGTTRASTALYCEAMDYVKTVPANAGATIELTAMPLDGLQIKNRAMDGTPIVVAAIPPAPQPFSGQFVQMDVVSVKAR